MKVSNLVMRVNNSVSIQQSVIKRFWSTTPLTKAVIPHSVWYGEEMRDVLRVENSIPGLELSASKATSHSDWLPSSVMRLKKNMRKLWQCSICMRQNLNRALGWFYIATVSNCFPRSHKKCKNEIQQLTKLAALNWRTEDHKITYSTPSIFCFAGSHCCL